MAQPLSPDECEQLKRLVEETWLEAHKIICVYQREFRRSRKASDWLKLGTFVAAMLTASAAAMQGTNDYPTVTKIVTAAVGILTAALVAYDQNYSPTKKVQEFWDSTLKLEAIKKDLVFMLYKLKNFSNLDAGRQAIEAVSLKINETSAKIPIEPTEGDLNEAARALRASVISRFEFSATLVATDDRRNELPSVAVPDAPDIVVVTR